MESTRVFKYIQNGKTIVTQLSINPIEMSLKLIQYCEKIDKLELKQLMLYFHSLDYRQVHVISVLKLIFQQFQPFIVLHLLFQMYNGTISELVLLVFMKCKLSAV